MDEIIEIHCYRKSSKPHRGGYGEKWIEDRVVNTLNTFEFHSDIRTPEIVVYVIEGHGSRPSHRGNGFSGGGVMYTLNTVEKHCVCYAVENHPNDSRLKIKDKPISETLTSRCGTGGGNVPMTLVQKDDKRYIVRYLTQTECARLQGFPDWWVDGAEGSDSAIYKMWGNGIALPCAADVIGRLAKELDK